MERPITSDDMEAFILLEKTRQAHNGIMMVELSLGHDGHNVVQFLSGAVVLGEHTQGGSLLSVVKSALSDWQFRRLLSRETWAKSHISEAIDAAIAEFGTEEGDSVFNSAQFLRAVNGGLDYPITQTQAVDLLRVNVRVVRLFGGAHWMLLPSGLMRGNGDDTPQKDDTP